MKERSNKTIDEMAKEIAALPDKEYDQVIEELRRELAVTKKEIARVQCVLCHINEDRLSRQEISECDNKILKKVISIKDRAVHKVNVIRSQVVTNKLRMLTRKFEKDNNLFIAFVNRIFNFIFDNFQKFL